MRFPLAVVAAFLACCGVASAGTGLILGVADDDLKWTEDTKGVVLNHQAVGFKAVRRDADSGSPGQTKLDDDGRTLHAARAERGQARPSRRGRRLRRRGARRPCRPELRTQYCSFVVDALSRAKNVNDVVIWNEVNSALFWQPQKERRAAYEALLAECYDTLHKYRRTVNVITSTSPHEDPGRFLRDLGDAYRASGRALPIFDTLGHNAYPETTRESPLRDAPDAALARPGRLRAG